MVKRYDFAEDTGSICTCGEVYSEEGQYVSYEDYAALLAEAKELKARIKQHSESVHFCEVCGKDDPCETDDVCWPMPETPITDEGRAADRKEQDERSTQLSDLEIL